MGLNGTPETRIGVELDALDAGKQDKAMPALSAAPTTGNLGDGQMTFALISGTMWLYYRKGAQLYKVEMTAV